MFKYQTIVILLIVLGAATCFIAYLSDQLGMKLGKKRISLWGLRPRQTATALSMASSLAVMLVTMLALLAINPSLRQGLLYYDEARRENARLNSVNAQLKTSSEQQKTAIASGSERNKTLAASLQKRNLQLTKLNLAVGEKQRQVNAAQRSLDVAQRNLNSAQNERQAAQRESENARRARDVAQNAQQRAQSGEERARAGFQAAQTRLQSAQSRLQNATQQEALAKQGVQKAQLQYVNAKSQLSNAQTLLSSTRTSLSTAQTSLIKAKKQTEEAFRKAADILRRNAEAQAQLEVKTKELDAKTVELEAKNRELARAGERLQFAGGLLSGDTKLSANAGETFGAATIPASTTAEEAKSQLLVLLQSATESARAKGFKTVSLVPSYVEQNGQSIELNQDASLSVAAYVASQNAPISMRVLAARDHGEKETQLLVKMQGVLVRPAFAANEEIARTKMRGGETSAAGDALIFNRLLALLDEGQKAAAKLGVAPLPTESEPNFYASDTRLRVFEALRKIQSGSGEVTVRLLAANEISTVEPVRIRIEVGDENTVL